MFYAASHLKHVKPSNRCYLCNSYVGIALYFSSVYQKNLLVLLPLLASSGCTICSCNPYSEPSFAVWLFFLNYERKPKHWIQFPTYFISFYFWHRRFRLTTTPCPQSPNSAWSQEVSFNLFIWSASPLIPLSFYMKCLLHPFRPLPKKTIQYQ